MSNRSILRKYRLSIGLSVLPQRSVYWCEVDVADTLSCDKGLESNHCWGGQYERRMLHLCVLRDLSQHLAQVEYLFLGRRCERINACMTPATARNTAGTSEGHEPSTSHFFCCFIFNFEWPICPYLGDAHAFTVTFSWHRERNVWFPIRKSNQGKLWSWKKKVRNFLHHRGWDYRRLIAGSWISLLESSAWLVRDMINTSFPRNNGYLLSTK